MMIDRAKFFKGWRQSFGKLTQEQVDGLESLIGNIEADIHVTDIRWAAYMLATVYHETGRTMQPIAEYSHGVGRPYGLPDPDTGKVYYGRGYVQLTWRANYEKMAKVFGVDFVHEPDLVMQPGVAYQIMSYGMRKGAFTGRRLGQYMDDHNTDYTNARRIINGLDCADRIARYAVRLEMILLDARTAA